MVVLKSEYFNIIGISYMKTWIIGMLEAVWHCWHIKYENLNYMIVGSSTVLLAYQIWKLELHDCWKQYGIVGISNMKTWITGVLEAVRYCWHIKYENLNYMIVGSSTVLLAYQIWKLELQFTGVLEAVRYCWHIKYENLNYMIVGSSTVLLAYQIWKLELHDCWKQYGIVGISNMKTWITWLLEAVRYCWHIKYENLNYMIVGSSTVLLAYQIWKLELHDCWKQYGIVGISNMKTWITWLLEAVRYCWHIKYENLNYMIVGSSTVLLAYQIWKLELQECWKQYGIVGISNMKTWITGVLEAVRYCWHIKYENLNYMIVGSSTVLLAYQIWKLELHDCWKQYGIVGISNMKTWITGVLEAVRYCWHIKYENLNYMIVGSSTVLLAYQIWKLELQECWKQYGIVGISNMKTWITWLLEAVRYCWHIKYENLNYRSVGSSTVLLAYQIWKLELHDCWKQYGIVGISNMKTWITWLLEAVRYCWHIKYENLNYRSVGSSTVLLAYQIWKLELQECWKQYGIVGISNMKTWITGVLEAVRYCWHIKYENLNYMIVGSSTVLLAYQIWKLELHDCWKQYGIVGISNMKTWITWLLEAVRYCWHIKYENLNYRSVGSSTVLLAYQIWKLELHDCWKQYGIVGISNMKTWITWLLEAVRYCWHIKYENLNYRSVGSSTVLLAYQIWKLELQECWKQYGIVGISNMKTWITGVLEAVRYCWHIKYENLNYRSVGSSMVLLAYQIWKLELHDCWKQYGIVGISNMKTWITWLLEAVRYCWHIKYENLNYMIVGSSTVLLAYQIWKLELQECWKQYGIVGISNMKTWITWLLEAVRYCWHIKYENLNYMIVGSSTVLLAYQIWKLELQECWKQYGIVGISNMKTWITGVLEAVRYCWHIKYENLNYRSVGSSMVLLAYQIWKLELQECWKQYGIVGSIFCV